MLLERQPREVTEEVFDSIKTKISFTSVATIDADCTGKLVRRLYLDLLLKLLESRVFQKHKLSRNMAVVVVSLNEKKSGEGSSSGEDSYDEFDEKAVQESVDGAIRHFFGCMYTFLCCCCCCLSDNNTAPFGCGEQTLS